MRREKRKKKKVGPFEKGKDDGFLIKMDKEWAEQRAKQKENSVPEGR